MYGSLHHWLIFGVTLNETLTLIEDEGFSTVTSFVIAIEYQSSEYVLYDVYNPCKLRGGSLNVTLYGTWSEELGLNVALTMSKYRRRANLQLMNLSVAFIVSLMSPSTLFFNFLLYLVYLQSQYKPKHQSLEDYLQDTKTAAYDSAMKFSFAMWRHAADMFNFR